MQIWGKVLGALAGAAFAKLPGLILGLLVGHMFDKAYAQDFSRSGGFARLFTDQNSIKSQAVFFHALFSTMGHIAKADGRVTQQEIQIATALMDQMMLQGEKRREAQKAFTDGKRRDFPLSEELRAFKESCHGRRDVLQMFLEILIQAAYADGALSNPELVVLRKAAKQLGFDQAELDYLLGMYWAEVRFRQEQHSSYQQQGQARPTSKQTLNNAYGVLGVDQTASDAEIKKAYRKLMSAHHPDKLVSKGLPKEAMDIAKAKAQDIQAAYEIVRKAREI